MAAPIIRFGVMLLWFHITQTRVGDSVQTINPAYPVGNYPAHIHQMIRDRLNSVREDSEKAEGRWSDWGPWSPCSRSCGGGVAVQSRQCHFSRSQDFRLERGKRRRQTNFPKGLNQCVGLYKRHQLCNDKPCSGSMIDFRSEQCAVFNNRMFRGKKYKWKPFSSGKDCELNCQPDGENFYATLNRTVQDGTACTKPVSVLGIPSPENTRGICVEGKCWTVGANGILGSGVSRHSLSENAKCESCSDFGPVSGQCRIVSGLFTRPQLTPGYSTITTIPKGACYVNVTQLRSSRNHLALRNPDGSYALNGNWTISRNGPFHAAEASFTYHRQDEHRLESISGIGPLKHPLDLVLVYHLPNPGIKYEYKIPLGIPIPTGEQIAPPLIDTRNSEPQIHHHLVDAKRGEISDQTTINPHLKGFERPNPLNQADEAPRILHHRNTRFRRKKYGWRVTGLQPCSKTCGGGIQATILACVREHNQIQVHERRCAHSEKPPSNPIRCNSQPCPAHWVGEWGPCSATCGKGEQIRQLECMQEISAKLTMLVNEGACLEPKPLTRQSCFVAECDQKENDLIKNELSNGETKSYWKIGSWSACSTTCGNGFRYRSVICMGGKSFDNECPHHRPHSKEPCDDLPPCIEPERTSDNESNENSLWLYTDWSSYCSDDCGTGHQYRLVTCPPGETCTASSKPDASRACSSDKNCGGKWYTGPWGRCLNPCNKNPVQKRDVLCVVQIKGQSRIVLDKTCSFTTKPEEERPCQESCPPQWHTGDWSACEGGCEEGTQKRVVRCLDPDGNDVDVCDGEKPIIKRPCKPVDCLKSKEHRTVDDEPIDDGCIDKIAQCQAAVQARLCQYKYYETICCLSCSRAPELPRD